MNENSGDLDSRFIIIINSYEFYLTIICFHNTNLDI